MIPGSANPLLLASAAGAVSYQIERSLRFNSSDSAYLSRTPASAGNRKTWTWAGWVKRSAFGTFQQLFVAADSNFAQNGFDTNDRIRHYPLNNGSAAITTTAVFRDPSAWYHIVYYTDTTAANASDRLRIYVNGVLQQVTGTYPAQNTDLAFNQAIAHNIGRYWSGSEYFNGYLADIHFIDGQALTPSSFTEVSATTGQLIPKAYSGSYGTNGFHLDFSDNSAATATTLGADSSGNGNNWTPNNLSVSSVAKIYANTGALTASSGVIANGGTPYWIDVLPSNAHLDYYGVGMGAVHDTSLSTPVYWVGDEYTSGNVLRARFDLRDYPTVSSVRIYSVGFSGYVSYYARFLDASKNVISGTNVDISPSSATWTTVPVSGSPRYLEIYTTSGGSRRLLLYAIEVNGGQLVNTLTPPTDSLVDTPTSYGTDTGAGGEVRGNYATLNPLQNTGNTLSNGNLDVSIASTNWTGSTVAMTTGKWYTEFTVGSTGTIQMFGVCNADFYGTGGNAPWITAGAKEVTYYVSDGRVYVDGVNTGATSGATAGDIISFAFDADARSVAIRKNNTLLTTKTITASAAGYIFYVSSGGGSCTATLNYGARSFAYTAPSGFKALCDTNLPAPVVAKPNTVMDVVTYNGSSGTKTITMPGGFSPDLVWIKNRGQARWHSVFDQVRGAYKRLFTNATNAEANDVGYNLDSFTSTGFTLLDTDRDTNSSAGDAYVAWCFDAGSNTVSNTQGSITSQVRANASAGFSIVTYTGNGTTGTVGHGLGVVPGMVIIKSRSDGTTNWTVWHSGLTNGYYIYLNTTGAQTNTSASQFFGNTSTTVNPSSSVITLGGANAVNNSSPATYVAYCFAPVAGYSSMSTWTGNGSSDGPMVWTGFRPRWLLFKETGGTGSWGLIDSARSTYNVTSHELYANLSDAEYAVSSFDFLSNGFKLRTSSTAYNGSGKTFIFAAFAESPFQYARAR